MDSGYESVDYSADGRPVGENDFVRDFPFDNHRMKDYDDDVVEKNQNFLDVDLFRECVVEGRLNEMGIFYEFEEIEIEIGVHGATRDIVGVAALVAVEH
jgi:hypothetical protein